MVVVPDGLKAWEILKGRPHNVDLILTEVDLPSISGYALLTLIMEHEVCKNIPVIMMSSQDSINTVYKCMLRGAADYLVKPLRKNELRNLWQHVWRRQSSTSGLNGLEDESVAQTKAEATAENNAPDNHSSGDAACIQRNKELIEKGSDAQSSCAKPDLEAESSPMDHVYESSRLKQVEPYPRETNMQDVEMCIQVGQALALHDNHAEGLTVEIRKRGETNSAYGKDGDQEHFRSPDTSQEAYDNHNVQITSSKEAIDLIGAFRNHLNSSHKSSSVNCTGKFDFSPQLDLSLRRSHPGSFENETTKERHALMHSNSSAFRRYTNRQTQAPPAVSINCCNQEREKRTNCGNNISNMAGYNLDISMPNFQGSIVSSATQQSKESELPTSPSQRRLSLPIPVKAVRYDDPCATYGSALPPMFCTQSGPASTLNPELVPHREPTFQVNGFYQSNTKEESSEQRYDPQGKNGSNTTGHVVYMQESNLEHVEDQRHISPTTGQSACTNSNADQVAMARAASESMTEELSNNGSSHRSRLREAALNKFRLKRKERCFEKKVRYESRKKLAEQRPRVKGQFVRKAQQYSQATEKDG
ncbi:two-component response regulator-like APRR5 isoform X2 [Neltuma alba]|uniref:two-component response regulator-like APRR5 isoform X2 n=1 Tax=Neltuma alba TaxID=207710 RepID=UPI0010A468C1|nr:two-component response regulator-like APRR5 isoform X2 [Prosopis alba]